MKPLDDFYPQASAAELLTAAEHWDALAADEERRIDWDRTALPAMIASKAAICRGVASKQRAQAASMKPA